MSYCRKNNFPFFVTLDDGLILPPQTGDSDVYVYGGKGTTVYCCGCAFGGQESYPTPLAMLEHLARHRIAGHKVPEHAILNLWRDVVPIAPEKEQ